MGLGKNFTRLWASQGLSNLGDGLVLAAAPLLAVALTRDPLLVAGMTVAQFLPWLLFTLPSGALTDRFDRRFLMAAGNFLRAAGFALLVVLLWVEVKNIFVLYLAVFVAGVAETLVDNAALTVPPRLVDRIHLERANGRLFATQSAINTFLGPPVGAALFTLSATLVFSTGVGLYALAGLVILALPALRPESSGNQGQPSFVLSIREGWSSFWNHRLLRSVAFLSASMNFFSSATSGLLVLLATGPLGIPTTWYGVFLAAPAVGALVGSLAAARVVPKIGGGPVSWLAALVPAASFVVMGLVPHAVVAALALLAAAVASSLNQIVVSTLRQAAVPDELLGRVTACYRLIVVGIVPFGAVFGGLVATWLGTEAAFVASGVGLALAALVFARPVTTRALRDAELGKSYDKLED